eukprot:837121-Rhodomonas_salina.1
MEAHTACQTQKTEMVRHRGTQRQRQRQRDRETERQEKGGIGERGKMDQRLASYKDFPQDSCSLKYCPSSPGHSIDTSRSACAMPSPSTTARLPAPCQGLQAQKWCGILHLEILGLGTGILMSVLNLQRPNLGGKEAWRRQPASEGIGLWISEKGY